MTFSERKQRRIEDLLKKAYADRDTVHVEDRWVSETMQRIRILGPVASGKTFFLGFEHVLWRLAPAACVTIIVLCTILYTTGFLPDESVFQVWLNGEEELTIAQLVGG